TIRESNRLVQITVFLAKGEADELPGHGLQDCALDSGAGNVTNNNRQSVTVKPDKVVEVSSQAPVRSVKSRDAGTVALRGLGLHPGEVPLGRGEVLLIGLHFGFEPLDAAHVHFLAEL